MAERKNISYKDAGVDKEEGYRAVELMKQKVEKTLNDQVLSGLGSFGAFYELGHYNNPVLVSGTDGVGTKLKVAFATKKYDTIGQDCVAMCVNDILCHGAKPLFFLDYLACGELNAEVAAEIVGGIADGCEQAGAALIGGETAEMPGFYKKGEYDIAGFTVGVVEKEKVVNGKNVKPGDQIIGLSSSGLHSNGFSLVRKLISDFNKEFEEKPIYETLLTPTKIYVEPVLKITEEFSIHGMAHITGGGLIENVPRTLPDHSNALIKKADIPTQPVFEHLQELGIGEGEMWNTFNMGIGFILIVDENDTAEIVTRLKQSGENASVIGKIEEGEGKLILQE